MKYERTQRRLDSSDLNMYLRHLSDFKPCFGGFTPSLGTFDDESDKPDLLRFWPTSSSKSSVNSAREDGACRRMGNEYTVMFSSLYTVSGCGVPGSGTCSVTLTSNWSLMSIRFYAVEDDDWDRPEEIISHRRKVMP
jgi:hypothetical protein